MPKQPRPDFSDYVGHFTKEGDPCCHKAGFPSNIMKGTARERLVSILNSKCILATPMPWTNRLAVAFTECTWGSLMAHTKEYSPYGIGFKKSLLFNSGGGPAIYLRSDLHEAQRGYVSETNSAHRGFNSDLYAFVTPFSPGYASPLTKAKLKLKQVVDYSHEREWRVPHDFKFELDAVEFVILPNYEAMASFPKPLKDGIGRERFILADVYSHIEKLWPVHLQ